VTASCSESLRSKVKEAGRLTGGDALRRMASGFVKPRQPAMALPCRRQEFLSFVLELLLQHSKDSTIYKLHLEEPLTKDQRSRTNLNHLVRN
jgi:hypothetical protein